MLIGIIYETAFEKNLLMMNRTVSLKQILLINAATIVFLANIFLLYQITASPYSALALQISSGDVLPYQGALLDSYDNPVYTELNMEFRIYNNATDKIVLWQEAHIG